MRHVILLLTFAILTYLTILHATALPAACPDTGPIQCNTVLHSAGSHWLGIPLVLWGLGWTVSGWFWPVRSSSIWLWIGTGLGGVVWGVSHEWALHLLCLWCTGAQLGILTVIGLTIAQRFHPISASSQEAITHDAL
ncbi:vitamin K epoxide reductase family protein [Sulfobacillus thermosulfidooxidans]|uniref:vitamin K epoxide reductase family protein n=1 Tax=Sulfobacillus thermosulfidooxidans TaxID=28034 RepID=UPI0006B5FC85|nr:vitamin K epoxide reductase family protein [Sulfobacillus thermosulfidooxidans]